MLNQYIHVPLHKHDSIGACMPCMNPDFNFWHWFYYYRYIHICCRGFHMYSVIPQVILDKLFAVLKIILEFPCGAVG